MYLQSYLEKRILCLSYECLIVQDNFIFVYVMTIELVIRKLYKATKRIVT